MNDEASLDSGQERLRRSVAEAIYGVSVSRARSNVEKLDFELERVGAVFDRARFEADRSSSILIFALIEDLMIKSIMLNLGKPASGKWSDIIDGNGLLSTANDRLELIFILRWIDLKLIRDLRCIKSIRNRFAHHADVVDFNDGKLASWINNLNPSDSNITSIFPSFDEGIKISLRDLFLIRSIIIIVNLIRSLAVNPISVIERVSPHDVLGGDFDELPINIKELQGFAADHVIPILSNYGDVSRIHKLPR
jgi:hypothetical protein